MKKPKMTRKNKIFVHIACNALIVVMLISVISLAFSRELVSVFTSTSSAIYRGDEENNNISLMINVYWGEEYIPEMLEILAEAGVKATFFIGGSWADKNGDLLNQIAEQGHEIANHGYFHKDADKLSDEASKAEILNAEAVISGVCGVTTTLFAPPSGAYNSSTLKVAESLGYQTIMWSKDTIDWRDQDTALILKRATTNQQNGDLILMHPTKCTTEALASIIAITKLNGFNLVTVSENIAGLST